MAQHCLREHILSKLYEFVPLAQLSLACKSIRAEYTFPRTIHIGKERASQFVKCKKRRQQVEALVKQARSKIRLCYSGQNSKFQDASVFANVHELNLNKCTKLTDISALVGVPHVQLFRCLKVTDLTPLGDALSLRIIANNNNLNISRLGKVPKISFIGCVFLGDVSALETVRWLMFIACPSLRNLDKLGNAHYLSFTGMFIGDASKFANVRELRLSDCQIDNVSTLSNVHKLRLIKCRGVTDADAEHLRKYVRELTYESFQCCCPTHAGPLMFNQMLNMIVHEEPEDNEAPEENRFSHVFPTINKVGTPYPNISFQP